MTAILFCGLVLVVAVLVAIGLRRNARLAPLAVSGVLLAYLAVPGMLAAAGALDRYTPLPAPALFVVLVLTLCTVAFAFSPPGARLAAGTSLGAIVVLQAFRIPVELMLHRLHTEGIVPVQMTYVGRNFDILTGISGLLLGAWLLSGRPVPRQVVLAWNVLGLALLANIVTTAVLSTPVPFRRFLDQPPHTLPSTFPFVWLPSFLVQVALGSHLLVFRQLRMKQHSVAP